MPSIQVTSYKQGGERVHPRFRLYVFQHIARQVKNAHPYTMPLPEPYSRTTQGN